MIIMERSRRKCSLTCHCAAWLYIFPPRNTNADSPLHPHIGRCIDPSHEWSMRRSESTVSSIVTIVDIVVVTQWFKFLTRDSPAVRLGANVEFPLPCNRQSLCPVPFLFLLYAFFFPFQLFRKIDIGVNVICTNVWAARINTVFTFYKPYIGTLPNLFLRRQSLQLYFNFFTRGCWFRIKVGFDSAISLDWQMIYSQKNIPSGEQLNLLCSTKTELNLKCPLLRANLASETNGNNWRISHRLPRFSLDLRGGALNLQLHRYALDTREFTRCCSTNPTVETHITWLSWLCTMIITRYIIYILAHRKMKERTGRWERAEKKKKN